MLKEVLENEGVEKVVWDSRGVGTEMWHGHEIDMKNVVDLQLVQVHQREGGRASRKVGALRIQDLESAFGKMEVGVRNELGVNLKRMNLSTPSTANPENLELRCSSPRNVTQTNLR